MRLADRAGRLRLLAVPRGRSPLAVCPTAAAPARPSGAAAGAGCCACAHAADTLFAVEASLASLRRPVSARGACSLNGRRLSRKRWRYDRRARRLRVHIRGRRPVLDVRRR